VDNQRESDGLTLLEVAQEYAVTLAAYLAILALLLGVVTVLLVYRSNRQRASVLRRETHHAHEPLDY
jgi:hypothetical protein